MDCLLLHVPRIRDDKGPGIFIMPSGVFSLADAVEKRGYGVRIVHLGLKQLGGKGFDLDGAVRSQGDLVVGMTLHWHFQAPGVLATARRLKEINPSLHIVLGGLAASCFSEELLEMAPYVDSLVRGSGEEPLAALCDVVVGGKGRLEEVPNLWWRGPDGGIRRNPMSYVCSEENTRELSHARFDLLVDSDVYLTRNLKFDRVFDLNHCFYFTPGGGCPVNCSFCGGGRDAQMASFGRSGFYRFDLEKALGDVARAVSYGATTLRMCFDPSPRREWYLELFRGFRERNWKLRMVFECWSLPDASFLDDFARTFTRDSVLILSPDCGSESVRRRNRGFAFSNAELLETATAVLNRGLRVDTYFSFGLPGETLEDLNITADLIRRLNAMGATTSANPMYLDPCSPYHLRPEDWGITLRLRTLSDFIRAHASEMGAIGYRTAELSEEEIAAGCRRLADLAQGKTL